MRLRPPNPPMANPFSAVRLSLAVFFRRGLLRERGTPSGRLPGQVIVVVMLLAWAIWGTPTPLAQLPGTQRTDLLRHDLSTPGREVVQALVEFAPGPSAPRHAHPGEEVAYVVEGELKYRLDGLPPVFARAGEALFIPSGAVHAVTNMGADRAAELATNFVAKDAPLLQLAE